MPTPSGAPFNFTLPDLNDLADLVNNYLRPSLVTINSSAAHLTATQTLTNKSIGDPADPTKKWSWDLSGATTGTTVTLKSSQTANRTVTLPDATDTMVGRATTDTLTNKTLTSPTLTTPAITGGTLTALAGLAIRDTSAAFDVTLAATSTSAALTAGRTLILDMGNVAHTLAFGTTPNTITFPSAPSGTVPLLNLAQTWTANQTLQANLLFAGATRSIWTSDANELDIGANGTAILKLASGGGVQVGAPTGGDKGVGAMNLAGGIYGNNVLAVSNSGIPQVPAIGTTFGGAADLTMTSANTFYTVVTLGSALVAGGTYLLSASALFLNGTAGDTCTLEIRDTTNGVTIWSGDVTSGATGSKPFAITTPFVTYSGYAGTPTIVVRCESNGAGDVILGSSRGSGAAANKVNAVTAIRIA